MAPASVAAWAAELQRALDTSPVDEAAAVRALEALKGFECPSKEDLMTTGLRDLIKRLERHVGRTDPQLPAGLKEPTCALSEQWFD